MTKVINDTVLKSKEEDLKETSHDHVKYGKRGADARGEQELDFIFLLRFLEMPKLAPKLSQSL